MSDPFDFGPSSSMPSPSPRAPSLSRTPLIVPLCLAAGLLLCLCLVGTVATVVLWPRSAPASRDSDLTPDYTISAQRLFDEFRRDRARAAEKYHGRILEVHGVVLADGETGPTSRIELQVETPIGGFESVTDTHRRIAIASASGVNGVRCDFAKKIPRPKPSTNIRVRGRCVPAVYDAYLRDCEIVK